MKPTYHYVVSLPFSTEAVFATGREWRRNDGFEELFRRQCRLEYVTHIRRDDTGLHLYEVRP